MRFLLSIFFLLVVKLAVSQNTFEKWFGGTSSDDGKGVVQLEDSGFAILARSWSYTNGGSDIVLMRLDKAGDTLWMKHYGGTSNEFSNGAIKKLPDGGFVIGGNTNSFGPGTPAGFNWYLIRTDSNGDTLWTRTWGSSGNDELKYVLYTSDGNFLLTGAWLVQGYSKGIVLKVDSVGNTLWGDTLASLATSHFLYACEDAQHNYVVTGYALYNDFNVIVHKYSANGTLLLAKLHDGGTAESGITIEPVPAGGYICSATWGFSPSFVPWILRLDSNLDTIFTRKMDFQYSIAGNSAKEYSIYSSGSGFIICGADSNKLMIRKTDANLNTIWQRLYGGNLGEQAVEGIPTNDGGFVAVGLTFSFGAGSADIYIVKTDSTGRIDAPTGFPNIDAYPLEVYPNPFNDMLIVKWKDKTNPVMLKIYDTQGRKVNEIFTQRDHIRLDLKNLERGVYFLTVESPTFKHPVKIVKQ